MHSPIKGLALSSYTEVASLDLPKRASVPLFARVGALLSKRRRQMQNRWELASIGETDWEVGDYGISRWEADAILDKRFSVK